MPAVETPPLQVRYIPRKAYLCCPSYTDVQYQPMPLPVSQYPEACLRWKCKPEYYRYLQTLSGYHTHHAADHIPLFRQAYIERIDGQLCHIIIIYARAIYKVTPIRIIAAYGINLLPCILRHLCHLGKGSSPLSARFLLDISRLDNSRYDALVVCVRLIICLT